MSLIVVEGVDASGKSTLLENSRIQIPKRYFVLLRHSCRPLSLSHAIQFMRMSMFGSDVGLEVIADRHPLISEPIYGPILRGSHLFEEHFTYHSEAGRGEYLKRNVARVIYCRPPVEIMKENISRNPQLEWVEERFDILLAAYDKQIELLRDYYGVPVVTYDWTTYDKPPLEQLFFGDIP